MLELADLHKYQDVAYKHIIDNPYCGLMMQMGLGKTVSTLTAIDWLIFQDLEIDTVLVVAPKRVVETVWTDEISSWSHLYRLKTSKVIGTPAERVAALKRKANIYLVSKDNWVWICRYYGMFNMPFDMLVIDESSSFKSYESKRFKAAKKVRGSFDRIVELTGTPAPNTLMDLWSQIYLLDGGVRLGKYITTFRNKYFRKHEYKAFTYLLAEGAKEAIHNAISDICISMKTEDFIELPERTDVYIKIPMTPELKKQYKDFEESKVLELIEAADIKTSEDVKQIPVVNAAALSNKLLQFANGAVYDEDRNIHNIHDLKIEALKEIVEESCGKSVLVAYSFQHDVPKILEAFKKLKPRVLKTEQDIRDWNSGKVQMMIGHPLSAGHGLNLQTGGSILVWYGLTWSLEQYQQMNARLHRQGQKQKVVIHHLVLYGSHDGEVINALKTKDKGQASLMAAIKVKINKYLN